MKIIVECQSDDFFEIKETIRYYVDQEIKLQEQCEMKYEIDEVPLHNRVYDISYFDSKKRLNSLRKLLIMLA